MSEKPDLDRRTFVATMATAVATASTIAGSAAAADDPSQRGGIHAIPELAPHWKKLDLAKILRYPAAFLSVSQNKSLYEAWGAQGAENHRQRGRDACPGAQRESCVCPFSRPRVVYYSGFISGPVVSVNEEQEAPMAIEASISKRALAAFGPGAKAHDAKVLDSTSQPLGAGNHYLPEDQPEALAQAIADWSKALER